MFGYDHSSVPKLRSYADALRRWENTEPLRGDRSGRRPLAERSARKAKWMVQHPDGAIGCIHWSTEVATYHPDGSITVNPWASRTTNALVDRLLPHGLRPDFCSQLGTMLWLNWNGWHHESDMQRGYLFHRTLRVVRRRDGGWDLHPDSDAPQPIGDYRIDTRKAREALKATRFAEFAVWRKAWETMRPDDLRPEGFGRPTRYEIATMLQDPEQWQELALRVGDNENVRLAIYADAGDVVTRTDLPYLTSLREVLPLRNRQRAYQYL